MKLKVLKMWLLASGIIMLSILVIALYRFGRVYRKAEMIKTRVYDMQTVTDVPGSKKILLTKKIDNRTTAPVVLNFKGGQVTIDELEMSSDVWTKRGLNKDGVVIKAGDPPVFASYGIWLKAEGKTATYSSYKQTLETDKYDGKPYIIFRTDLISENKDSTGEEKLFRRYFITAEPDNYDGVSPVYDLIVGSVDQKEIKDNLMFVNN